MKIHILVTWHRLSILLDTIWNKDNYNSFLNEVENLILKEFPNKSNYIFHLWWCEGWDNDIWQILLKNWYYYEMFIVEKDLYWKSTWDNIEKLKFSILKKFAKKVYIIKWWYMKRDKILSIWCTWIVSCCLNEKSWTWFTIKNWLKTWVWQLINHNNIYNSIRIWKQKMLI